MRFICVHFVMNHFHHMSILCRWFILSSTGPLVRKLSLITVSMFGEILHKNFVVYRYSPYCVLKTRTKNFFIFLIVVFVGMAFLLVSFLPLKTTRIWETWHFSRIIQHFSEQTGGLTFSWRKFCGNAFCRLVGVATWSRYTVAGRA